MFHGQNMGLTHSLPAKLTVRGPPIPSTYFLGSGSGHDTDFRVPENVFRATDHFWGLRYVLQRSESVECRGNGIKEKRETKVRSFPLFCRLPSLGTTTHKHYSLETLGKRARSIPDLLYLPLSPSLTLLCSLWLSFEERRRKERRFKDARVDF